MNDELKELIAEAGKMAIDLEAERCLWQAIARALDNSQWGGGGQGPHCPSCGAFEWIGHRNSCPVAQALMAARAVGLTWEEKT